MLKVSDRNIILRMFIGVRYSILMGVPGYSYDTQYPSMIYVLGSLTIPGTS